MKSILTVFWVGFCLGILLLTFKSPIIAQNTTISIIQTATPSAGLDMRSIWEVNLIHSGNEPISVYIQGKAEDDSGIIYQAQTKVIKLLPGLNTFGFSHYPALAHVQIDRFQQGESPTGILSICLLVFDLQHEVLATACQQQLGAPSSPPKLVYPFDEQKLASNLPVFSWLPPMPIPSGISVQYTLRMLEYKEGMDEESFNDLSGHALFFYKERIPSQQLIYPMAATRFDQRKTYAWQIEAFAGNRSLGKTDIWTFRFTDNMKKVPKVASGPFPELKPRLEGGYYLARKGLVRFRFDCQYDEKELNERIQIVNQQGEALRIPPDRLEKVGDNRFVLHLLSDSRLEHGSYYTMKMINGKSRLLQMRFKYWKK